jgi:hypothetical protein
MVAMDTTMHKSSTVSTDHPISVLAKSTVSESTDDEKDILADYFVGGYKLSMWVPTDFGKVQ